MAKKLKSKLPQTPKIKLAHASPHPIKGAARSTPIDGVIWPPVFNGGSANVLAMQVQFDISQWWSPERLQAFQLTQLLNVLRHAYATVPFYKDRLKTIIEKSSEGISMNMYREIPLLTRSDFQDAGDDIITNALPPSHGPMFDIRTSGSTGQPLVVKGSDLTGLYVSALGLRYNLWHKRDFGGKSIHFLAMKPEDTILRTPNWGPVVNGGEGLKVNHGLPAEKLLDILIEEDPEYVQIHPSVLKEIVAYSIDKNLKPKKLREVRSRSEILYPELRDRVEQFWGVRVTDNYSCEEVGIMALQCPEQRHYHVQSESCLIEILRDDGTPCQPGEVGRVVISSLNNFGTPLIRYENGDLAEVGTPCSCGRGLPVLKRIVGRIRNVAILPNGERRMPAFSTEPILNDLPIKHFQLVQKTYTDIEARFVVSSPLTKKDEDDLVAYFNSGLQYDFNFTIVYLDEITRGKNGKYEVFKCEVSPP